MKHIITLILIIGLNLSVQAQTTHIVDNNPNGIGDFTKISDAISAASPGDIILLVPSVDSYGDISFTSTGKQLTIAGGGANGGDATTTLLGSIVLSGGSTSNTNLDGFVLGGFVCKSIDINFVDNAKVKAVRTTEVVSGTSVQMRVRNSENVELEYFSSGAVQFGTTPNLKLFHGHISESANIAILNITDATNFIISNTIFAASGGTANWLTVDDNSTGQFAQCVIRGSNKVTRTVNFGANTSIVNSIFAIVYVSGTERGGYTITGGSSYQNNTFYTTNSTYYALNNNTVGDVLTLDATADQDGNVFANPNMDANTYVLADGSAAKDSGSGNDLDGTIADRGIFGGLDPMPEELPNNAIGISVVPTISRLRLSQPTAVTGGKVILKVTGKSKKN